MIGLVSISLLKKEDLITKIHLSLLTPQVIGPMTVSYQNSSIITLEVHDLSLDEELFQILKFMDYYYLNSEFKLLVPFAVCYCK